jgi:hypothetical protein
LYIIEEICLNKIEGIVSYFKERIEIINAVANYYSTNKKLVEVTNSIIAILTDKPIQKKQNNYVEESDVFRQDRSQSGYASKNTSSLSTPIVSTSVTNEVNSKEQPKFSFIKKKNEELPKEVKADSPKTFSFIKSTNTSTNEDKISVNSADIAAIPSSKSKFSFIKATTSDTKVGSTCEAKPIQEVNNNPVYDLTSKLNEVFNNINVSETTTKHTNHFNNLNLNLNVNGHYTNGHIRSEHSAPIKPKYDAPDFDIIFHTSNLTKVPSPVKEEPVETKPEPKDHFDFVNDLLKKK